MSHRITLKVLNLMSPSNKISKKPKKFKKLRINMNIDSDRKLCNDEKCNYRPF